MNHHRLFFGSRAATLLFFAACSTTGVNPTGMTGGQVSCPSGPRPLIDCRGVLQQYSRDLKADLNLMQKTQIGFGLTTTKLMEADSLTSDLLQHSYQTCTLYNACIVSPQDYAGKTEKLQQLQLEVRRTLLGAGYGQQQNIQINPPFGQPFPPGGAPGQPIPGQPFPGQPGQPYPGGVPHAGAVFPGGFDPNQPQQFPGQPFPQQQQFPQQPGAAQFPIGSQPGGPAVTVQAPGTTGSQVGDTVINILREGSKLLRSTSPAAGAPAPTPTAGVPGADLDSALRGMLQSLKQDVAKKSPALGNARAVVGNFTEEGRPYSGPMGALLQERVSTIVMTDGTFRQATGVQTRGITVKDVQGVKNANDPKALPGLYNSDLAIAGTYQARPDGVSVKLTAVQPSGEVAQANRILPANVIPNVVDATPQNANDTNQLLGSMSQVAPRAEGQLNITTNRPGQGSNFRLGEEITYFVNSSSDGYLYLFHIDGEKNAARIFPNQYQPNPAIRAGQVLQLPQPGAPFKFEASPPFGLETTFAIVTPVPLADNDLQMIQASFATPNQVGPTLARARGIAVNPAGGGYGGPAQVSNSVSWNSVTVLIRP